MTVDWLALQAFPERCIGTGTCVELAPLYFDQREDDGTVVLRAAHVKHEDADDVERAVDSCPVFALSLARRDGDSL
jgi:ferredoxin